MPRLSVFVIGFALGMAAGAHGQTMQADGLFLNTSWAPPGSQRCLENEQEPLPLDQVFDSLTLSTVLGRMPRGSYVVSVRHNGPDTARSARRMPRLWSPIPDTIAVVESRGADTAQMGVGRMLLQSLRPNAPRADFLLRVDIDHGLRFRTVHSTFCPPAPRDQSAIRSALTAFTDAGIRSFQATVWVLVRPDGTVADLSLEGTTFQPQLDDLLRRAVLATRFYPPLIDRVPLAIASQLPLSIGGR